MTNLPEGCRYSAKRLGRGCAHSTSDCTLHSVEMPGLTHPVSELPGAASMFESMVSC